MYQKNNRAKSGSVCFVIKRAPLLLKLSLALRRSGPPKINQFTRSGSVKVWPLGDGKFDMGNICRRNMFILAGKVGNKAFGPRIVSNNQQSWVGLSIPFYNTNKIGDITEIQLIALK